MTERSDRLRMARIEAGFEGPAEAADRFGWNRNSYKSNENGNAPFSFRRAKEYARAFGVRAEWLYDANGPAKTDQQGSPGAPRVETPVGRPVELSELRRFIKERADAGRGSVARSRNIERRIPVVGEVAAGLWKEAPQLQTHEWGDYLALDVPGYERAQLRAWRVVGPSMNMVYPEGRYVVTAHPAEAGLRVGDHVVVERHKMDLVEITLKEFLVDEDGRVALWPRSNHPDFQSPIYLKGYDELDQTLPQIVGVVVADYAKRNRPPLAFGS